MIIVLVLIAAFVFLGGSMGGVTSPGGDFLPPHDNNAASGAFAAPPPPPGPLGNTARGLTASGQPGGAWRTRIPGAPPPVLSTPIRPATGPAMQAQTGRGAF